MQHIAVITSKGGHLYEMYQLEKLFHNYPHFWITFQGKDTQNLLKTEKKYYAYYPESRNIINFFRNAFLAFKLFVKEKPTILISCGAGIAVPFFLIGKYMFKTKLIYIESFDFVSYPSLTGKILYKHSDLFLVQHICQKKWFPKAKYWGSLL
ncbi:MAG TPA: PssD/Cps14F family polysaccharide biosynthesis glycosyltransferase [Candidatus Woesebacteria bacterium]|nr:PssD/Cps14F family polysaccharide biosynthesis glycosyltransferase [Candidatus Woesebacteria bacterium]